MTQSHDRTGHPGQALFGTIAVFLGTGLIFLSCIEATTGVPGMPRFWYTNRPLWWLISIGTFVGGGVLLYGLSPKDDGTTHWSPSRPGRRFRTLVLYTRVNCGLCVEARELLERYGRWLPQILEVDIDTDPRLVERFGTCVPVVALDGKVRFRGRINEVLLRRLIDGTRPVSDFRT